MAERTWTADQLKAINTKWIGDSKSCNILVNAAAGSGKTAVLVERIIRKLIPNANNPVPIDVDRLLVVTFTNAAATEMKDRISDALSDQMEEAEAAGDYALIQMLKHQTLLLYDAHIMTIDAFCMRMIRQYFHLLGIDPNFGIAENARLALMSDEAMEELFEDLYESGDEDFLTLSDLYTDGRDDTALAELIRAIYDFTRAMPNPTEWLVEKTELFLMGENPEGHVWIQSLLQKKNNLCHQAYGYLKSAMKSMIGYMSPDNFEFPINEEDAIAAWGKYYLIIKQEMEMSKNLLQAGWDESHDLFGVLSFDRLSGKTNLGDDEKQAQGVVRDLRDKAKKALQEAAPIVTLTLAEVAEQLRERVYPQAAALAKLTKLFEEKYSEKKAKKNVLDFSDVEHLCLRLFSENEEVCRQLQDKYEEILMDEYQDSNSLQEEIFKKIARGDNLFMVGDMKQSIYRFRRSDPALFKEKSDTFSEAENAPDRKIILSANFRSRGEVLDSVNAVFEKIMSEAVGGLAYDESQWLNTGNLSYEDYAVSACGGYQSECYVLEACPKDEENEDVLKEEVEAAFIARKINELKQSGFMVRDGGRYRVIQNRDIAILMSSCKNVAATYTAELNRFGIDCFAESGGYFEKNEIRMILSLIRVIQNPYQDIPLLGVLRSFIGGFTDDELVQIRMAGSGLIYSALQVYARNEGETADKCRDFLTRLQCWRDDAKTMTCDRLLWTLYEETGLYAFVGALFGGEEARANLRLLFERAKQYEDSGYKGLFNFIRYIGKIKKQEEDLPSAKLVGEGHDVVRIMTIHKSKGLEFPIVFLAGCGKQFLAAKDKIQIHKDLGLGVAEINFEENYRVDSVATKAVAAANAQESKSEEERKLYVALTRAKEKLIVTGVVKPEDTPEGEEADGLKCEMRWDEMLSETDLVMSTQAARSANCFLDWIAPSARRSPDQWKYEFVPYEPVFPDLPQDEVQTDEQQSEVEVFDFQYPHADLSTIPTKISVTELKRMQSGMGGLSLKREAELAERPAFMAEIKEMTAAERGSVIHMLMQKTEPVLDMNEDYIRGEIEKLIEGGSVTREETEGVDIDKILDFYQSEIGQRILKSQSVVREIPFETQIPLKDFPGFEETEDQILLQGVIDCYFEEEDGVVLLDYKSDYYTDPSELKNKYQSQVEWYAYAIEKITGKKVKQKYLYLFFGNDIVEF